MNKKENFTVIFIKFDKLIISNRRFGGRRATCAKLEGESSLRREGWGDGRSLRIPSPRTIFRTRFPGGTVD